MVDDKLLAISYPASIIVCIENSIRSRPISDYTTAGTRIPVNILLDLVTSVFYSTGMSDEDSKLLADSLVTADL